MKTPTKIIATFIFTSLFLSSPIMAGANHDHGHENDHSLHKPPSMLSKHKPSSN
ncbi:hypothetical protein MNBD_GAMMA03-2181 [hydrothermal vent metagenome]|uniref:Uncharacterized protein n=1 Tax=hydrothermal vent metagenome TaxID=652676 RepID=A0A3B0WJU1_9ZZZZ